MFDSAFQIIHVRGSPPTGKQIQLMENVNIPYYMFKQVFYYLNFTNLEHFKLMTYNP